MTRTQAHKIALDRFGPGVHLKQTQGKGKYGKCQIWLNSFQPTGCFANRTRQLVAHGDTWEEALKEAGYD